MGIGVSDWKLARAVSQTGQLGVVSGSAINTVLIRRLQLGDPTGDVRRAMGSFPFPGVANRVLAQYFAAPETEGPRQFALAPLFTVRPSPELQRLSTLASFVEVFLAKEGHDGLVGMNLLEKFQLENLSSLYGAMLAGVDFILMGAGIPREIPGVLDKFAKHAEASLRVTVKGEGAKEEVRTYFDPLRIFERNHLCDLKRPLFLGIVSSATLALHLVQKSSGKVDGFVIEGHLAGGHNAPPRGAPKLNEQGEPIYGEKDVPDLEKFRQIGLPFWLAGAYGSPEKFVEALGQGATGIQVGTAFAFCDESGFTDEIKTSVIRKWGRGVPSGQRAAVYTDPAASPTGFPFKVSPVSQTLSERDVFECRPRKCDLGYLRDVCIQPDGSTVYRCPGEPVGNYLAKGGAEAETVGKKCLCNSLFAAIGLAQLQEGDYLEPPLVTAGDALVHLDRFLPAGKKGYTAKDVVEYLLSQS